MVVVETIFMEKEKVVFDVIFTYGGCGGGRFLVVGVSFDGNLINESPHARRKGRSNACRRCRKKRRR